MFLTGVLSLRSLPRLFCSRRSRFVSGELWELRHRNGDGRGVAVAEVDEATLVRVVVAFVVHHGLQGLELSVQRRVRLVLPRRALLLLLLLLPVLLRDLLLLDLMGRCLGVAMKLLLLLLHLMERETTTLSLRDLLLERLLLLLLRRERLTRRCRDDTQLFGDSRQVWVESHLVRLAHLTWDGCEQSTSPLLLRRRRQVRWVVALRLIGVPLLLSLLVPVGGLNKGGRRLVPEVPFVLSLSLSPSLSLSLSHLCSCAAGVPLFSYRSHPFFHSFLPSSFIPDSDHCSTSCSAEYRNKTTERKIINIFETSLGSIDYVYLD